VVASIPAAGPGPADAPEPSAGRREAGVVPFPRRGAGVPRVTHEWRTKPALTAAAVLAVAAAGVAVAVSWPSAEPAGQSERFPDVAVVTPSATDVEPPAIGVPTTPAPAPTLVPTVAGAYTSIPVDVPDGRGPGARPNDPSESALPTSAPAPAAPTRSPAPKPPPTAPTAIPPPTTPPPTTTAPPIVDLPPVIVPPPVIEPPPPAPAPLPTEGTDLTGPTTSPASKTRSVSSSSQTV
jgi:hypothetical protein